MSRTPAGPGPVRPIAEINDAIRQLVAAGGAGSPEHEELLAEWLRAAVRPAA